VIFKVVSRADGGDLARYLLSTKNEQVHVLNIRGTVISQPNPRGLVAALKDFDELAKITKGRKTIVHLAINPDDRDKLGRQDWQYAVEKAEAALGLSGQPRAVVSHVFKGKEHVHVAWSRVDIDRGVCIQMSHSKLKACQAAREVELQLGLQQTPVHARGMQRARKLNQSLVNAQKHQSERTVEPTGDRQAIISDAWHQSQSGKEFKTRIEAAGYKLAIGNRGPLVMDGNLETYSIARSTEGVRLKDVREKFADLTNLPTVEDFRQSVKPTITRIRARSMTRDEFRNQIAIDQTHERERGLEPNL
jgi:hypothetical protein